MIAPSKKQEKKEKLAQKKQAKKDKIAQQKEQQERAKQEKKAEIERKKQEKKDEIERKKQEKKDEIERKKQEKKNEIERKKQEKIDQLERKKKEKLAKKNKAKGKKIAGKRSTKDNVEHSDEAGTETVNVSEKTDGEEPQVEYQNLVPAGALAKPPLKHPGQPPKKPNVPVISSNPKGSPVATAPLSLPPISSSEIPAKVKPIDDEIDLSVISSTKKKSENVPLETEEDIDYVLSPGIDNNPSSPFASADYMASIQRQSYRVSIFRPSSTYIKKSFNKFKKKKGKGKQKVELTDDEL